MKKIFVNITSWVGSIGAEHFYANATEIESDENIFVLAQKEWDYSDTKETLQKTLSQTDADYLNKKDRSKYPLKKGEKTIHFNSVEEIIEATKLQYPNCDIAFFKDYLEYEIFEVNPQTIVDIKKTGRKIKIHNFNGFSSEFKNLIEGSIHDVIESPEKHKSKNLQNGVWVWGITEPVLVLSYEFVYEN